MIPRGPGNPTASTRDIDVEPPIVVEVADCCTFSHVHIGQAPFCGSIGKGAVSIIDEEMVGNTRASTTRNEQILPAIAIKISANHGACVGGVVIDAGNEGHAGEAGTGGLVTELRCLSQYS